MKGRSSCIICDYQAVCLGGWWTFVPDFCCELKRLKKASRRKKRSRDDQKDNF